MSEGHSFKPPSSQRIREIAVSATIGMAVTEASALAPGATLLFSLLGATADGPVQSFVAGLTGPMDSGSPLSTWWPDSDQLTPCMVAAPIPDRRLPSQAMLFVAMRDPNGQWRIPQETPVLPMLFRDVAVAEQYALCGSSLLMETWAPNEHVDVAERAWRDLVLSHAWHNTRITDGVPIRPPERCVWDSSRLARTDVPGVLAIPQGIALPLSLSGPESGLPDSGPSGYVVALRALTPNGPEFLALNPERDRLVINGPVWTTPDPALANLVARHLNARADRRSYYDEHSVVVPPPALLGRLAVVPADNGAPTLMCSRSPVHESWRAVPRTVLRESAQPDSHDRPSNDDLSRALGANVTLSPLHEGSGQSPRWIAWRNPEDEHPRRPSLTFARTEPVEVYTDDAGRPVVWTDPQRALRVFAERGALPYLNTDYGLDAPALAAVVTARPVPRPQIAPGRAL